MFKQPGQVSDGYMFSEHVKVQLYRSSTFYTTTIRLLLLVETLHRLFRLLRKEKTETFLDDDSVPRELVVRREPRWMGWLRRLALRTLLLQGVNPLSTLVNVEHEKHCGNSRALNKVYINRESQGSVSIRTIHVFNVTPRQRNKAIFLICWNETN